VLDAVEYDPAEIGDARFTLARSLWDAGGDRKQAVEVATRARDSYAQAGDPKKKELQLVAEWLARHPTP
jgi:hypothetical protein